MSNSGTRTEKHGTDKARYRFKPSWLVLLLLFALLLNITGLHHGLIDPDEGRYAEVAREMLESGNFVTPRLNYMKYYERPALYYWLTAFAFRTLGQSESAARVTSVILGFLGAWLVYQFAWRITRRARVGFFATAMLFSSVLWYAMSHINTTDMTMTFFLILAMGGYHNWFKNGSRKNSGLLVFYAATALATLTEGLVGIMLPLGIALLHVSLVNWMNYRLEHPVTKLQSADPSILPVLPDVSVTPDLPALSASTVSNTSDTLTGLSDKSDLTMTVATGPSVTPTPSASDEDKTVTIADSRNASSSKSKGLEPALEQSHAKDVLQLFSLRGITLFLAIILPWFWLICRANPDFFRFFWLQGRHGHSRYAGALLFLIPVLLAALVPWTGLLLDVFHVAHGRGSLLDRDDGLFLALWAGLSFVFYPFSGLSGDRLVPHILPCLPPLVILMGTALELMLNRNSRWAVRRFVVLTTFVLVPVIVAGILYPRLHPEIPSKMIQPLVIVLSVFWMMSFGLFWKRRLIASVLCLLGLLVPLSCVGGFNYFADLHSQRELSRIIMECIREGDKIVAWRELKQSLSFYTNSRIVIADTLGELEFGANALSVTPEGERDRDQWFVDSTRLRRLWNGPNRVFLVTQRKHVNDLTKELRRVPVRLGETRGEVLCSNF